MKKTKFIALALVVAIALMGAGYAAWTDKLVVQNTVETAKLDVDFVKVSKGTDPELVVVNCDIKPLAKDDADNAGSNDFIEMTIKNLYPGAKVTRTVTLQNLSTIPVKIFENNFVFEGNGNKDVRDAMNVKVILPNNNPKVAEDLDVELQHGPGHGSKPAYITLAKNATMDIVIEFELDYNKAKDEITEDKKDVVYTMTLNFDQFNNPNYK